MTKITFVLISDKTVSFQKLANANLIYKVLMSFATFLVTLGLLYILRYNRTIAVLPGIIGSIQALEAIKIILGLGDSLRGRLLAFDALEMSFREYKLNIDPANEVTHANRDLVQIAELEGLCAPRLAVPAG